MTLVSGNINRLYIFEAVSCRGVIKPVSAWDRWNRRLPFSRWRIYVRLRK